MSFSEVTKHLQQSKLQYDAWSNYTRSRHAQVKKNATNQDHTPMTAILDKETW